MWPEGFGEHAGVVACGGGADLEASVASERVAEDVEDVGVVVDDEDAFFAAVEDVGGNVVGFHEAHEFVAWDAPEARAGDSEAFESS